jgi:L-asparagine transporter-like permease
MNRIWKFFQYGYLIIAIICVVEALLRWSTDRNRAYLFLGFAVFIVVIFLFKRHFRKKVEKRNNQNL